MFVLVFLDCKDVWSASREIRRASLARPKDVCKTHFSRFFSSLTPFSPSFQTFRSRPLRSRTRKQQVALSWQAKKTSAQEAADFRSTTPVYSCVLLTSRGFRSVVETIVALCFCAVVWVQCPFKRLYYVIDSCLDLSTTTIFFCPKVAVVETEADSSPVVSLCLSLVALSITPWSRRTRYAKTTGDESKTEVQLHVLTSCLNSEKVARCPSSQKTYASLSGNLFTTLSNLSPIVSASRGLVEVP